MRIENRRSKIETVVTKEQWAQMVDQQVSKLFRIIDKDETIRTRINIPREIQEFKLARPERIVPKADITEEVITQFEEIEKTTLKRKPIKK
jgi:hypothetical protein